MGVASRKRVGKAPPAMHQTVSGAVLLFQAVTSRTMRTASFGLVMSALR